LLALPKATATPGSSTLHSWTKMTSCSSPLSATSAIAPRAGGAAQLRIKRGHDLEKECVRSDQSRV